MASSENDYNDFLDDIIAKMVTWSLSDIKMKELLRFALKPQALDHVS